MDQALDLILKVLKVNGSEIGKYASEPQKYKNNGGQDLFGYPPDQLSKAALYYFVLQENRAYAEALDILTHLKLSMTIEEYATIFKQALFKNSEMVDIIQGKTDLQEIVLTLYSAFLNKPITEIKPLVDNRVKIYADLWREIVPDEDQVTPEQLGRFYNSLPFPVGCFFTHCFENNLVTAFSFLPMLLIRSNNFKRIFDFGGNSGLVTSAIAGGLDVERCVLIEENDRLLEFAKWRDKLFNVQKVEYIKESALAGNIQNYAGTFDFGICTEVLEHLYDVEGTVALMAQLFQTGGVLFQTTSFGLYPEDSHLKKNLVYANREDELMAKFGFDRIEIQFPLPLLATLRIYRKR